MTPSEALTKLRNQRVYNLVATAIIVGLVAGILKFADGATTVLSAIFLGAGSFGSFILIAGVILVPMGVFTTPPPDATPPPTRPPTG